MGSDTCPKSTGEWCSLTFRGKKSCLVAEVEGPPGTPGARGEYFLDPTLVAGLLSTCGSGTDSEWQSYDRFSEHRSFIWQSLKELHFLVTRSGIPPQNFVSSIVEIFFPRIYCPMLGMPSCNWLSHTCVTTSHTGKTRRIRLIVAVFSWIYSQMGCPWS